MCVCDLLVVCLFVGLFSCFFMIVYVWRVRVCLFVCVRGLVVCLMSCAFVCLYVYVFISVCWFDQLCLCSRVALLVYVCACVRV